MEHHELERSKPEACSGGHARIIWDIGQSRAESLIKRVWKAVSGPRAWANALTLISASILGGRMDGTLHTGTAVADASTLHDSGWDARDPVTVLRVAQDTSTTTVTSPPPTPHHDVHSDKTMPSEPPVHIDTHGDSN
jgi:hypothetical protein